MRLPLLFSILLVLILVFGSFLLWQDQILSLIYQPRFQPLVKAPRLALSESLGAQIIEKAQNPVKDNLPEINPFASQLNPFEGIYVNPFR